MPLALVRHERSDVADNRRMMRKPELPVEIRGLRAFNPIDIDAFVNSDGSRSRNAVPDQHLSNRVRRADETINLTILPPRQRVATEMKINPPGGDQGWF